METTIWQFLFKKHISTAKIYNHSYHTDKKNRNIMDIDDNSNNNNKQNIFQHLRKEKKKQKKKTVFDKVKQYFECLLQVIF